LDNIQGGHQLMLLQTNKKITRQHVTKVPITATIIKKIEKLAIKEKMPKGLKSVIMPTS
jgi:hypothetical protein